MTIPKRPTPAATSTQSAGLIWLDGDLVPEAEATVSVLTHALHYGTSVFEGIRAYRTERGPAVFRLREHAERLVQSAKIVLMRPPVTAQQVEQAVVETLRANRLQEGYVRPLLWYGAQSLGIDPTRNEVRFMVAALPWGSYLGEDVVRQGAKLMTSSWRRSPGDVLPTKSKAGGNYVNSVLANQEARDNGFDEALLLDKAGYVAEGSGENVFFVKDGVLHPIAHSVNLRGITRDSVVQIAKQMGLEVVPTMATRDELYIADEVFLVGTAAEVTPVASIDRRPIGEGRAGEVSLAIRQRYLDVVRGRVPGFEHWLTYVDG
ncbi:MAG: branched-chain amino acid transaminase [Deinococcales bacterium]|nr:branched-chain amino acid transaminase [Deinococcales bacterium]